jgi:hypothetical protein
VVESGQSVPSDIIGALRRAADDLERIVAPETNEPQEARADAKLLRDLAELGEPPRLRDETIFAIEAAIIVETGNGEVAAYTARYLQGLAALREGERGPVSD